MSNAPPASDTRGHPANEDCGLAGLHKANVTGASPHSLYPPSATRVFVDVEEDGYHDIVLLDEQGRVVARSNRSRERIENALEGGAGYDIVTQQTHGTICEYCGMPIKQDGQLCAALDDGVCAP